MQKIFIYSIITIFSVGVIILGGRELLRRGEEEYIRYSLDKSNYCKVDGDCIVIEGVCPISCVSAVNLGRVDEIRELLNGYNSMCRYGCLQHRGVRCTSLQRCEIVY